jgi:hypothetical protein
MRRVAVSTLLAIVLAFSAIKVSADSQPSLSGSAFGIELCPQFICGFALFAGQFQGQVNSRPAKGSFAAAIVHEDLPAVGETAAILGGQWTITAGRRVFRGNVTDGTLLNLNDTQFCVTMTMALTDGGSGEIYFSGVLDHGPFPPTIGGYVTQSPTPCPVGP